ncbi:MAG: hypothetical protein L6Q66_05940 [Bacteroidia bacterium]|nr:hypothetical protein [Bacteroidia bacterium]
MLANKDFSEFREADKIISYLKNPDGKTQLNANLRKKLDRYTAIYSLKLEFKQSSYIVSILKELYGRNERQARADISETEYIFGKVVKIDTAFEKAYLVEACRRNLELAFKTKDTVKISKAIEVHKKVIGDDIPDDNLPDFSKYQQHTYNIVIPPQVADLVKTITASGAINLSDVIPSQMVKHAQDLAEDAEEVKDVD